MLTLTDTAAEAIRGIVAAPELPDGAGLRIATQPGPGEASTLEVSVAETPAETDQVVDESGARVFVEADAVLVTPLASATDSLTSKPCRWPSWFITITPVIRPGQLPEYFLTFFRMPIPPA